MCIIVQVFVCVRGRCVFDVVRYVYVLVRLCAMFVCFVHGCCATLRVVLRVCTSGARDVVLCACMIVRTSLNAFCMLYCISLCFLCCVVHECVVV